MINDAVAPFVFDNGHLNESFDEALTRFVRNVNEFRRHYFETNLAGIAYSREIVSVDPNGKKYLRLVARRPGAESGSAWCFIEVETGAVLKCDGFKRPAKGVRGTIYATDWAGYGCSEHGPRYAC